MNHSCGPTCAVEFDFTAQIFVLKQPYAKIEAGA